MSSPPLYGVALRRDAVVHGCASVPGQVRVAGAQDLECPIEEVSAYEGRGGVYVARGCGKWAEYNCLSTRFDTMCVPRARAEVHTDFAPDDGGE
jgi:hypothetical protein